MAVTTSDIAATAAVAHRSRGFLRRNPTVVIGLALLGLMVAMAVLAPAMANPLSAASSGVQPRPPPKTPRRKLRRGRGSRWFR